MGRDNEFLQPESCVNFALEQNMHSMYVHIWKKGRRRIKRTRIFTIAAHKYASSRHFYIEISFLFFFFLQCDFSIYIFPINLRRTYRECNISISFINFPIAKSTFLQFLASLVSLIYNIILFYFIIRVD